MLELYKKKSIESIKNKTHVQLDEMEKLECNTILAEFITKFKAKHLS
jgi:hypothetical protein